MGIGNGAPIVAPSGARPPMTPAPPDGSPVGPFAPATKSRLVGTNRSCVAALVKRMPDPTTCPEGTARKFTTWPPTAKKLASSENPSTLRPANDCGSARSTPFWSKRAAYPSSPPVTIQFASGLSARRREAPCASCTRDGSRQSSTSGTGPLREKENDCSSVTTEVICCFAMAAESSSAAARSAYGPIRITNGAAWVIVPFRGDPIARKACCASAAVPNGPAVTSERFSAFAATTNDRPRAMAVWSASSLGRDTERSRTRCHPALTSVITRAKAAGSPPSAYAPLSLDRSARPSASGTSRSRIGPVRSRAVARTLLVKPEIDFAASRATVA